MKIKSQNENKKIDKSQNEMYIGIVNHEMRKEVTRKVRMYLKKRREELKMSQKDVANAIGISQNYYCDIENEERQQDMKATTLIKLSNILRISVSEMLEEERKLSV